MELYIPSDYGTMEPPKLHGLILRDLDGNPTAVVIGSYESNGEEPWEIRGEKLWIGVGLASTHIGGMSWCADNAVGYGNNISNLLNVAVDSWKLADNNVLADGSGQFVSRQSTQAHMDGSLTAPTNSKLATDYILAFDANMKAARHCRTFTLDTYGQMDLPSIDVLMRIYQARDMIDALDPTLVDNPNKGLQQGSWGKFGSNGDNYVWSSSPMGDYRAWCVLNDGKVEAHGRDYLSGVVPVIEIPVE